METAAGAQTENPDRLSTYPSRTMRANSAPDLLTDHQWNILLAIADGFVGTSAPSTDALELNPSSCPAFIALLSDTVANRLPPAAVKEIKLFISIISGYTGYAFNGTSTYLYDLPRDQVEQIILGWTESRLKPIRQGAKALGFIIRSMWIRTCPGLLPAIGHPGHLVPESAEERKTPEDLLSRAKTVEFEEEQVQELTTGVLVVGSGSGATAFTHSLIRNLRSQNWRALISSHENVSDVLLLEKGSKFLPHPEGKPMSGDENEAFNGMVEGGGVLTSDEGAINIFAGSTWGGGSRINWSACLQTDRIVREEWTRHIMQDMGKSGDVHGRMFLSKEWQDCMEHVEEQLGVQLPAPEDHNLANKCLIEGSKKLGYTVKAVPQNISGSFADHAKCGASCTIGCRGHAEVDEKLGKMSGCRAFLDPLLSTGNGPVVKGMEGFEVERVVFADSYPKKAVGVVGWARRGQDKVRVVVRAKIVVVSGGTLNSPAVLLRSGIKNPHLGYHLHLHPTLIVQSIWPTPVDPWSGTILTAVINEFSNQDGKGHGVKLEAMCMLPSLGQTYVPWAGSNAWRERMRKFPKTMGHIVLCREEATGRVYVDASGKERISYVTGTKEREWIRQGFEGMAKLLHAQGAEEIYTSAAGLPIWRREGERGDWADDQSFIDFLEAYRKSGFDIDRVAFGSAHQMGTCRMSGSSRTGVVDVRGKVWGVEGLYVADASVFPSASGVNPMITTMSFGEWIGRRVVEGLVQGVAAEEVVRARL